MSPSTTPITELRPDVLAPLELAPLELAPLELAPLELAPLELAPLELAPLELAPLELAPLELAPALLPAVPVEGVDDGVDDGVGDGVDDGVGDGVELEEVPPVIPPSARTSLVTLPRPGTRLLAGGHAGDDAAHHGQVRQGTRNDTGVARAAGVEVRRPAPRRVGRRRRGACWACSACSACGA